jgi:hypothetical protein
MAKSLLEVARYTDAPQIVPSEGQNSPGVLVYPLIRCILARIFKML